MSWDGRTASFITRQSGNEHSDVPFGISRREVLEWTGFAIASGSLPAAAFAVFAFSNLAPRARDHHAWYLAKFKEYPKRRKALIPLIY